ncbi:hypothetical protein A3844_18170 [Paenibacillus helianthi]|uniref:DUF4363 domain-containing protein n=1 Tax=Paenibacillus helianthi TaxID=1349432 RepID=A0ABX3EMS1_9BACL|nr:hypothetical protein [Paenibacillus helianthi]OKP84876.1 hypothetical protein A3844_18170 [Paenibacillus helianthi]
MTRFPTLLTASFLALTLILSGCGSKATEDPAKKGANDLISVTNDIKKEIDAGNDTKVKELGPKLEETWATFEDSVKTNYADDYEKIEESLNPEVAATKASQIDSKIVSQLNDNLNKTLTELVQKMK